MQNKVICLMGPTATGKTALSLAFCKRFPAEIVSVDSVMIYRGMDIGTAKPSPEERACIPHYLIDICEPSETYSAGQFCSNAQEAIQRIVSYKKLPLLTGGTMLYFNALQQGLSLLPTADKSIREKINAEMAEKGPEALHAILAEVDALTAARIASTDSQRIQRALEVYRLTGIPLSQWHQKREAYLKNYQVITIALIPENRESLKARIARRFHEMLEKGLITEVESLYKNAQLTAESPAMRSVGYRQVWAYLAGDINYDTMVTKAIIASHQLAKRQLTWIRTWPGVHLLNSESPNLMDDLSGFVQQ